MSQSGTFFNSTPAPGTAINTLTGNSGGAVGPTGNNVDIIGAHGLTVVGSPGISTLTASILNAITLGDLAIITAGNSALTAQSGDITISGTGVGAGGNLNLPATNSTLTKGVINVSGFPFIGEYGGVNNTGIGINAAAALTTGINNTAVGNSALLSETIGQNNTTIGASAGVLLNTSIDDTVIGSFALSSATATIGNTVIGSHVMASLLTGEENIAIGHLAGNNYTGTESDNILIGNAGVIGENNTIHIGTQGSGVAQQNTCFIAGIIGNTVSNPRAVVINHVTGQLGEAASTGSAIDAINGNTGATVLPIAGAVNIETNHTLTTLTFNGSGNTLTLVNNGDFTNLSIGTGYGSLVSGIDNTSFGEVALNALTSGSNNTAIGGFSLFSIGTGSNNSTLGFNTGQALTSGSSNTLVGSSVAATLISASNNTAIGFNTLNAATTGSSFNTVLGSQALSGALSDGNNNIAIGFSAASNYVNSESNNIIIGNNGLANDANIIRIGTQGAGTNQQNTCFIAGIIANTVSNTQLVTINSVTGQLGITTIPLSIANGGTNATAMTITDGTVIYDGTRLVTTATGTAGQVLTSNGPGVAPTYQNNTGAALNDYFLFYQGMNTGNILGDSTSYQLGSSVALTQILNNNGVFFGGNGVGGPATFTAPINGVYFFIMTVQISVGSIISNTISSLTITTTSNIYQLIETIPPQNGLESLSFSTIASMNAGNTATFSVVANRSSANTIPVIGSATIVTSIAGYRIA